jgi:EmrB/QacA subfamily drug resistance transporter
MKKVNIKIPTDTGSLTLLVAIFSAFVTTFSGSALNLSIPAIDNEFSAGATAIGWIISGYILAAAAMSVPIGRLADLTGRERILKAGIIAFSVCSGATCFAGSMEILLLLRILQGISGAMIFSTNQAVLISRFSREKHGKVLGYFIGATYTGLTAGPVLGGILNHLFGWRSIFLVTFIIGVITFALAKMVLPSSSDSLRGTVKEMDLIGSLLFIITIFSMMYGLSAYSTEAFAKYLIPVSVLLFMFFVRHELHAQSPVIQVRLFRKNIGYLLSNLAALLNYGATFALGYLLSIYLQVIRGFDSQAAGLILISQPLIMALLSPFAGRLSDRIASHKLASFGMGLCALGLFLFIFISAEFPLVLIILYLIIVGIGFAFFSSPNTNAVMSCVEPRDYGVASSILATMRNLGHSSSMAIVTFIVATFLGSTPLSETDAASLIHVMKVSYIVFTCLCIAGVFISLKRDRV